MVLSVRNNNPGNLRPRGASDGFQGFSTPQEGLEAMRGDLLAKISGKSNAMMSRYGEGYTPTLETLLTTWAPPEENDTENYIRFVAEQSGIDPTQALTEADIDSFMPAMVQMEGGQEAMDHFYGNDTLRGGQGMDTLPDSDIAALEAEFGEGDLSDEDFAALEAEFANEPDTWTERAQAFMTGAADTATFGAGDELRAGLQALVRGGIDPNVTVGQAYDHFLGAYRDKQQQRREDTPVSYGLGQVAGAVAPGIAGGKALASVGKLSKYARTKPLATAASTGAVSGGIYGYNSGEGDAGQRAQEAAVGGGIGAVSGPVGARVAQAGGNLLSRAKNLLKPQAVQQVDNVSTAIQPNKYGETVPLTQGQGGQTPDRQAMEIAARRGAYGSDAQKQVMDFDAGQQDAIRGVMTGLGAGDEDALQGAGKMVRGAYKGQKAKVSQAYGDAEKIKDVYVNKQPIQETFVPRVKQVLNQFNLDERDLSPAGKMLAQDLNALKGDKISAVNLAKMEKWRGKASNIIANNNQLKGNAAEGAAFKNIVDEYDRFMAKLPEDALKSGDEDALQAILKARGERRKQGVLFERDKVVKKIVQSQDITDEELANMVLTGSGRSENLNTGSGRLVKNLKRAVGDKAPELQENLKSGLLARVIRKSTDTTTQGATDTRIISPSKLRNQLEGLVKNKTLMKELFSPEEIEVINGLHKDMVKISSTQPGADNYSNTAYTLMRFAGLVPFGRAAVGDVLESLGNKTASKDIKKGLSPVLDKLIDDISAQRRFYGAATGQAAAAQKPRQEDIDAGYYGAPPEVDLPKR